VGNSRCSSMHYWMRLLKGRSDLNW
jgi:hypothetical protein